MPISLRMMASSPEKVPKMKTQYWEKRRICLPVALGLK
jgi:hypothetical protein